MPINIIECVAGADRVVTLTLRDALGNAITTYTDSATLTVSVWPGDDQAETFAPAAAWVTDGSDGQITLTFAAADTDLTPGDYSVLLSITASGRTASRVVATLRIQAAPGSGTAPAVYCTLDDLQRVAGGIDLRRLTGWADQTGFREQRAEARAWLDRQVLARVRLILEDQRSRHAALVEADPIEPVDGIDAGPAWGPSTIPDTTLRDQETAFRTLLDADALMVDAAQDGKLGRRIAALYAVAEILDSQVGPRGENPYFDLASQFRTRAVRLLPGWVARIDSDVDGVADYEIRS